MAATWESTITVHGDPRQRLVDISAVRTDGDDVVTVQMVGVRVENATAALRDAVAAELKARATQQIANDAIADTLTGWASQLDTALDALES